MDVVCRARCLTYLNNRYYDPSLGNFVSVDPLVGKTGTPYLYANGNPATLSDPNGMCSVGGSGSGEAGYAEALSSCVLSRTLAQSTSLSAHGRLVYTLHRIWSDSLGLEKRRDAYEKRQADEVLGGSDYYFWDEESRQRMVLERATDVFMDRVAKEIAGITSTGNGLFLFPEEGPRPEPGRPSRTQDFATEIVGASGWKSSLVDDPSPARHLVGWLVLGWEYGHGQATAGLRVAEGDPTSLSNSQQDYDLGVVGIDLGSDSISVPEMIAALDLLTGDAAQGEFAPQRVAPNFPGMGQRGYTCYLFDWC